MYKYIHDQALRLANQGLTPLEAAEIVELPDAIGKKWYNRYYHGGLHHNVRAVFHKELGYWDGDPAVDPAAPARRARQAPRRAHRPRQDPRRGPAGVRVRATTGGRCRSSTTSCSPTPTTPKPRSCRPTPTSSSGYQTGGPAVPRHLPHRRQGAARRRRDQRQRSAPPARTPSWRCRSTCCSTSSPSTSSASEAADVDVRINFTFTDIGRRVDDVGPPRRAQRP